MIAEIISVGTEILLGQIVNTDAVYLATKIAELGINSYFQTVVGDNAERLEEAIEVAEKRCQLLIFTGGLGPTQDDITKEVLAKHLNENLVTDQKALKRIEDYFNKSGRIMTENNRKQALYFENGLAFANRNGHAIGTYIEKGNHAYLLVPGPPKELTLMFENEVYPFLEKRLGDNNGIIVSKTLRFFGIGESELVTKLSHCIETQTNPTVAAYAGDYEVTLRLTAKAKNTEICHTMLEKMETKIMAAVGEYYYGEGADNTLVKTVASLLRKQSLTLSAAESLTGGMFQSKLVSVPNSSEYFIGGIVSYHARIKQDVLGVSRDIIQKQGVVSEACAIEMAERCRRLFQTDLGISFTGVAGPNELEGKPAGTAWIGISRRGGESFACQYRFMHDRQGNRERAVMQGLDLVRRLLATK